MRAPPRDAVAAISRAHQLCSFMTLFSLTAASGDPGRGEHWYSRWRTTATTVNLPKAVEESEEVVPVNVSTWVLPSGVMVGR